MTKAIQVVVVSVGQNFGTAAVLLDSDNETVGRTRTFPYGFRAQAFDAGLLLADAAGYHVVNR